ncbi:hypothetical protein ACEQUB_01452 [Ralstonia syzygii]
MGVLPMHRRCGRAFYRAATIPLPMRRPIPKQKGEPPCDSPCLPDLPWDYFFSGGWLNGKVPNMFLAWLCICSCICTNRFLLCSM